MFLVITIFLITIIIYSVDVNLFDDVIENIKLSIEYDKAEKSKILKIDNIQYQKWLEEKHMESLKFQTLENQEKIQKRLKR